MADRVMLHIMVSAEELAGIDCFRRLEGMRTKREAVCKLIALGLVAEGPDSNQATAESKTSY
jgi:hypothetical protein